MPAPPHSPPPSGVMLEWYSGVTLKRGYKRKNRKIGKMTGKIVAGFPRAYSLDEILRSCMKLYTYSCFNWQATTPWKLVSHNQYLYMCDKTDFVRPGCGI